MINYIFPIIGKTREFINEHWFRGVILFFTVLLFSQKEVSFQIQLNEPSNRIFNTVEIKPEQMPVMTEEFNVASSLAELVQKVRTPVVEVKNSEPDNKANNFHNISAIISRQYLKKHGVGVQEIQVMRANCLKYVKRFAPVAKAEMRKYGIPASIKLAQALLESDAGESRLANANNNHFGIKCFSKKCTKNHCSNFTDDTHKDFFRKFGNAWESFRAHSLLLQGKRYQPLKKLSTTNYKAWAVGLKKAGYATDKRYAEKLIEIIEELGLDKYDAY